MQIAEARVTYALKIVGLVVLCALVLLKLFEFVGHIRTVAIILLGAIFLCYIIYPAVRRLQRRVPLWAAILIVYAALGTLIAIGLAIVVPALSANASQLIHDGPVIVRNAQDALNDPNNPLVARLPAMVRDHLDQVPAEISLLIQHYGGEAATGVLGALVSTVALLALFVIMPVMALYILLDLEHLAKAAMRVIPEPSQPRVTQIVREIDKVVGGFIRGQLLVAAIVGVLVIVLLSIMHVKYAILIGVLAGLFEIIPYVGAFAGAIPAILIALFTNGWQNAVIVTLGFVIINQLEGHLIAPFIVSESVGLSPLIVILALLIGGELFGLPGLIIAVPVAGILRVILSHIFPGKSVPAANLELS